MQMSQHGTALTCDDFLFDHNTQSTCMSTSLTPREASIYLTPPPPLPPLFLPFLSRLPHSYHQKYLLRQQRDVLSALNLPDKDLVTSHVAARLNGYCGGYGSLEALEEEMPKFNLPENIQKRVRGIMSRKSYN